jgi:hypothetical protein
MAPDLRDRVGNYGLRRLDYRSEKLDGEALKSMNLGLAQELLFRGFAALM